MLKTFADENIPNPSLSNKSHLDEEEIYEKLSTKFQDIVGKIVLDVLRTDNDNYDMI